jgi:predicted dienelactone hydrolase
MPVFEFPVPKGPYAIGTVIYHWVDPNRPEPFTADPNDHRELMAQVWYPATNDPGAPRAPYLEDSDRETAAFAAQFRLPSFVFSHLKYVKTHAVLSAPVADDQSRYPVVIFVTGIEGYRQSNMLQIEELASRGYVVVGLDQPGTAAVVNFPDGRQILGMPKDQVQPLIDQSGAPLEPAPKLNGQPIPNGIIPILAPDVSFTLDQLAKINAADPNHVVTGRLDLEHVGAFGVSLGAMVVAEACLNEPRLKACLMYDAFVPLDVVNAGLDRPAMWLTRDANTMRREGWTERNVQLTYSTMRKTYEEVRSDAYFVQIPTMYHANFTDISYWSPAWQWLGLTGPIDVKKAYGIVNSYTVAFFDKHLRGMPAPLLDNPSAEPDVNFQKRLGA